MIITEIGDEDPYVPYVLPRSGYGIRTSTAVIGTLTAIAVLFEQDLPSCDLDIVSVVSEFISEELRAIEEREWLEKDQQDLTLQELKS
ncbi:hypothetical protein NDU88_006603 [Pleurodeles waltl]|uniref:Uncharacterized protein n=1 Tax=Pleurodeles waltl TaxID=8319 RepID=A0AAV7QLQ0_PLEWA|nr:hypothetical protein NDU88_006603 [Pleurodeles waltl]